MMLLPLQLVVLVYSSTTCIGKMNHFQPNGKCFTHQIQTVIKMFASLLIELVWFSLSTCTQGDNISAKQKSPLISITDCSIKVF